LLVGLSGPDDAAVWRLDDRRAIVVTTDFFTPIVDDPYAYGAIAAANSLSDIYAMGGRPFLALNIAALPEDLPLETATAILRGGAEKAREAGVVIAGGHTVKDREPKYGLVAVGFVDPQHILGKSGLRVGDALVLTKPLGFGLTTTALKQGMAATADVDEAVTWMSRLNEKAAVLAVGAGLKAGTDVTGYGLLGHGYEMAVASGVGLNIDSHKVPFLAGATRYAAMGALAGGLHDNRTYFGPHVEFATSVEGTVQKVLFDPQTSGGLLLGVPPGKLDQILQDARDEDQSMWVIGTAVAGLGISVE
jgi:selenide,water dikinase